MAFVLLLALLAIGIATATAILIVAVVSQAELVNQWLGRESLTVTGVAMLFGLSFVVVGASTAVRHLASALLQRFRKARTGRTNHT